MAHDHFITCCTRKLKKRIRPPSRHIKFRSYKHFDDVSFKRDFEKVPWSSIEAYDDIDDAWAHWRTLFLDVCDEHAPFKERRFKGSSDLEWFRNDEYLSACHQRDYWKKQHAEHKTSEKWA